MTTNKNTVMNSWKFLLLGALALQVAGAQVQMNLPVEPGASSKGQSVLLLACSPALTPSLADSCKLLPYGPMLQTSHKRLRNFQSAGVFQVSTLDALSLGVFQASMSVRELRRHGDFGVGTFDGLDGEMVGLDGRFFQVRSDGTVTLADNDAMTPFAVVTNFKPHQSIIVKGPATMAQLFAALDQALPSRNYFYAVRIHGHFNFVTARSVSKQVEPYPTLAQAIAQQAIFPLPNIRGTLVGFRSPAFEKGINQPGYHFHFISQDEKSGGHALDFEISDAIVEIQTIRQHSTVLPEHEQFQQAPLPLP